MDPLIHIIQKELTNLLSEVYAPESVNFLLAVSGGIDSMVLAHVFLELELDFGVAHFNFRLRDEASDLDEELVHRFCSENDVPFFTQSEDTTQFARERNLSIQEAARELRYSFFDDIADKESFDFICTAHHGNDQVETFFINLFRGSGLKGLTGMPQRRDRVFRPMLWIPHEEILRFARQHNVEYRDDASNQSGKYLRNRIRHQMIEPLTESNHEYLNKALSTISLLTDYQKYIDIQLNLFSKENVRQISPSIQRINISTDLITDPSWLFLLKLFLLDQSLYPDKAEDFIGSVGHWKTGSKYEGSTVNAWYDREQLWLISDAFYETWDPGDQLELTIGSDVELPGGDKVFFHTSEDEFREKTSWSIPFSQDKVELPLIMRHRKLGDTIQLGTPPYFHKNLKKLFNDQSIPRPFKDRLYVLTDSKDRIISVPGMINCPIYTKDIHLEIYIEFQSNMEF